MRLPLIVIISLTLVLSVSIPQIYAGSDVSSPEQMPPEYSSKQLPKGLLTNSKAIEEGRAIFQGEKYGQNVPRKDQVNCSKCHGNDGKPVVKRVPDFSDRNITDKMSDSLMFWKISEGIPEKKMAAYKDKLTEEDRWSVIAYIRTLSK